MSETVTDAQALIAKSLDRARAGEDRELATQVRERGEQVAHLLSGTTRMTHIHHIDNRAFEAPCRELAAALAKLHDLLGLTHAEIDDLEAAGIIADRPRGL